MANTKDFFLNVTKRIFSNWTALRMAVEHGMAPKDRALDFCIYITEVIYMNEGLCISEIATELEDYMDDQFNTEAQDNSTRQVARELLRFYRYCKEGDESTATAEFEKLAPLQLWIEPHVPMPRSSNTSVLVKNDNSDSEENDEDMETVDDEWTTVRRKR